MSDKEIVDLHNEDCMAGLANVAPGCARLIFADPPYNLSGEKNLTVKSGRLTTCNKGAWDVIEDIHQFNLRWLESCKRVLADDGTLWVSGTLHNHPSIGCALKELGFWLVNDVIWFKRNAPPLRVTNRLAPSTELIWVAAKSKKYYFDYELAKAINGGKQMRNLWDIKAERHTTMHPTEKPETLLERIVQLASAPGDVVIDPFMGSGTTGVVAKRLQRNFTGFEIDSEYFQIASARIEAADKTQQNFNVASLSC